MARFNFISKYTVFLVVCFIAVSRVTFAQHVLTSPDKNLVLKFDVNTRGIVTYALAYKEKAGHTHESARS